MVVPACGRSFGRWRWSDSGGSCPAWWRGARSWYPGRRGGIGSDPGFGFRARAGAAWRAEGAGGKWTGCSSLPQSNQTTYSNRTPRIGYCALAGLLVRQLSRRSPGRESCGSTRAASTATVSGRPIAPGRTAGSAARRAAWAGRQDRAAGWLRTGRSGPGQAGAPDRRNELDAARQPAGSRPPRKSARCPPGAGFPAGRREAPRADARRHAATRSYPADAARARHGTLRGPLSRCQVSRSPNQLLAKRS
jgi:hypothetical protein